MTDDAFAHLPFCYRRQRHSRQLTPAGCWGWSGEADDGTVWVCVGALLRALGYVCLAQRYGVPREFAPRKRFSEELTRERERIAMSRPRAPKE